MIDSVAIPDFAGRTGKAIYNDVDQIYLADPALLFDLPLDGHGYLAIDAARGVLAAVDQTARLPCKRTSNGRGDCHGPLLHHLWHNKVMRVCRRGIGDDLIGDLAIGHDVLALL